MEPFSGENSLGFGELKIDSNREIASPLTFIESLISRSADLRTIALAYKHVAKLRRVASVPRAEFLCLEIFKAFSTWGRALAGSPTYRHVSKRYSASCALCK